MIPLDNFETSIPEKTFLRGEELYEQYSPKLVQHNGDNLYIFNMEDSHQLFESEILLSGDNIKKSTCECQEFRSKKVCPHIVCSLFKLREIINTTKHEVSSSSQVKSNFSVDDVLQTISHEELCNYIKSYAKVNQKFKLNLKANFARRISNVDPETKYQKILDSIIKPIRSKESQYASSSIANFLQLAQELRAQMRDAISLEQYTEAFYIHKNLLQKSAYALTNAKKPSQALYDFYESLHNEIDILYQLDFAPELKDKLSDFLLQTLSFSYYVYPSFQNNLARKIFEYSSKSKIEKIAPLLQKKFKYTSEKEDHEIILALEILASELDGSSNFQHILKWVKSEYLKNTMNYILKEEKYDLLYNFISEAKELPHLKNFPYDDILIYIAEKKGDTKMLAESYLNRYKATRKPQFLEKLIALDLEDDTILNNAIRIMNARKMHQSYLVDINIKRGKFEEAFRLLQEYDHFDRLDELFEQLYMFSSEKIDTLLHAYLEKAKASRNFYLRHNKTLKSIFLTKDTPEKPLWESLFGLTEEQMEMSE